jgi:hypothetical protein
MSVHVNTILSLRLSVRPEKFLLSIAVRDCMFDISVCHLYAVPTFDMVDKIIFSDLTTDPEWNDTSSFELVFTLMSLHEYRLIYAVGR